MVLAGELALQDRARGKHSVDGMSSQWYLPENLPCKSGAADYQLAKFSQ